MGLALKIVEVLRGIQWFWNFQMEPTHLKLEKVAPFWLQKHPETLSRFDLKIWGDQPGNLCQDAACAHAGPGKVVVEFFFGRFQVGVSKNRGAPKWMVYNENPIKMDDLGVPLFSETSRWMLNMWPVGFGFSDLVLDFRLIRNFFIQCLGPWKCHTTTHQLHFSIRNELLRIRIL